MFIHQIFCDPDNSCNHVHKGQPQMLLFAMICAMHVTSLRYAAKIIPVEAPIADIWDN